MLRWLVLTSVTLLHGAANIKGLQDGGLGSDDEVRLLGDLFQRKGYNPLIRPVKNINESVVVLFNMALIQLINVDEKNQILKTNVWLRMVWHDYQLEWEPYDYGGISVVRIIANEVWKPDIVLFNNADGKYEVSYKSNVVLSYTGEVLWVPPAIYQSSCTIDVTYFPFDEQECLMKFGSWTFNGDQVVLGWYDGKEKVDLSDYVNSGTWDVMSVPGNNTFDWAEGLPKSQITYTLRIRRKTLFYTVNLIMPVVLISFLSVSVFFLPADAHEKMTMCISILLALVVFLLLVSKILPPTSLTVPLMSKYLLFTFIMNIFTIISTVVIINWNFRTPRTHRMRGWARAVFLNYLPRVVFVKRPQHELRFHKKAYNVRHDAQAARDRDRLLPMKMKGVAADFEPSSGQGVDAAAAAYGFPAGAAMAAGVTSPAGGVTSYGAIPPPGAMGQEFGRAGTRYQTTGVSPAGPGAGDASVRVQSEVSGQGGSRQDARPGAQYGAAVGSAERGAEAAGGYGSNGLGALRDRAQHSSATFHTTSGEGGESGTFRSDCRRWGRGGADNRRERGGVGGERNKEGVGGRVAQSDAPSSILDCDTYRAVEAVRFIAAHLRNEDDYEEILEDWRYIALVIDRLELYVFLAVTVCGTIGILINAPHIFEYVDQDRVIEAILSSTNGVPPS